jgi:hypothetical protein
MADGVLRVLLALAELERSGRPVAIVAREARGGSAAALVLGRAGDRE